MIKLFGFGEYLGIDDLSPFVLKVMTFMRMCEIRYETVSALSNLQKAPKGKLPFIEDNGNLVADSFFIIKYLKEKYNTNLDSHLSDEQVAISHLITKSLDENFYWCVVYSRWLKKDTWPVIRESFFGSFPLPLKILVPPLIRKSTKSAFLKHGMGKHNDKEILEIAKGTMDSLSQMLGDKEYFFGEEPSSLDATVYAFLAELILVDLDNSMNELARSYANLVDYCKRIENIYFKKQAIINNTTNPDFITRKNAAEPGKYISPSM